MRKRILGTDWIRLVPAPLDVDSLLPIILRVQIDFMHELIEYRSDRIVDVDKGMTNAETLFKIFA